MLLVTQDHWCPGSAARRTAALVIQPSRRRPRLSWADRAVLAALARLTRRMFTGR
jgi:hypothetical protein